MSDAVPLPPRPDLEQYKKLAKDFQRACKSGNSGSIRDRAALWLETVARLQGLDTSQATKEIQREADRMERRWRDFRKSNEHASRCTLAGIQFFIAREHGFSNWPKFLKHVQALSSDVSPISKFEAAADAIVTGDIAELKGLLDDDPELVRSRSTREHRSTLLHYVSANGIEDFRQKTPHNIIEITKLLVDAGSDVNAESEAYGGGSTTLGLAATSIHPEKAGLQIALLQTLLDYGAKIDHPTAAGNKQSIVRGCLANGQPRAAEFLASAGAHVDLVGAAGLGRLADVRKHLEERGRSASSAQIESAFEYACWYGRSEVVDYLLGTGIEPGWRNADGQTGLHCAAYGGHVDAVKLLLLRGCPVDVKDNNYRATALDVALYVWSNSSDAARRERCYVVIALLAREGAKLDPEQWRGGDPDVLSQIQSDSRMAAALRGEGNSA
jgi:ankyrin repeat protein